MSVWRVKCHPPRAACEVTRQRIAIVDYGMGNLHSAAKAIEAVSPDSEVLVTADAAIIDSAERVVFPGVGAIRDCMAELNHLKLADVVSRAAAEKPLLAICIGMQAMMSFSDENGGTQCLGLLPGRVRHFATDEVDEVGGKLKVPHMGWNQVHQTIEHPLWQGIAQDTRFYFVHSYFVAVEEQALVAGSCDYGVQFAAALSRDNVFALQFHPEKSHTAGLALLRNFSSWDSQN